MKIETSSFIKYIGRINYVAIFIIGILSLSIGISILFNGFGFKREELKYFVSISAILIGVAVIIIAIHIRKDFEKKINQGTF